MKGVQRLVLVVGVVWGCLVKREVISIAEEKKWLQRIPTNGATNEDLPDCFGGRRPKRSGQETVMKVLDKWETKKTRDFTPNKWQKHEPNYKVKRQYTDLWLAGIANACAEKRRSVNGQNEKDGEWCKLYAEGPGANIALHCSHEEHDKQFKIWSRLVEPEENDQSERNEAVIIFKETNPAQQSFLCALPNGNETIPAEENMPNIAQNIGKQNCNLVETASGYDFNKNCHYEMTWLGHKVASYTCPIRKPQNCSEVIKREYEKKNRGSFNAEPTTDDQTEDGKRDAWQARNCSINTQSSADTEPKKFEFNDGKENDPKHEIWCTLTGNKIKCRLVSPCEVAIKVGFGEKWTQKGIEAGINYQGEQNDRQLPPECASVEGSQAPRSDDGNLTFKITDPPQDAIERRFSCRVNGGTKISCHLLPKTCGQFVQTKFNEKCGQQHDFAKENVNFGDAAEMVKQNPENICPLQLPPPNHGNCVNGKSLTFTINEGDNKNRRIMCNFTDPGTGISCKLLPLTCTQQVKKDYATCGGSGQAVQFGQEITDLEGKGGTYPADICPLKRLTEEECKNSEKTLKYTTEVAGMERKVSCSLDGGSQILCRLLPKTCSQFVQRSFKENCNNGAIFVGKEVFFESGVDKLEEQRKEKQCPLEKINPQNGRFAEKLCKANEGGNSLVFRINGTTELKDRDILCNFTDAKISCGLVGLTCAQTIQETFQKKILHSLVDFQNLVAMERDGGKRENLNNKKCEETEEINTNAEKTFKITSGANEEQEILCKNGTSLISCSLLPPRCSIEKYTRNNENKPLRCDKTEENITISSASFVNKERIVCKNEQPKVNTERNVTCEMKVEKIGKEDPNTHFYCKTDKAKGRFGENVCAPLHMIEAVNCTLQNLTFHDNSACNNTRTELSIPEGIYVASQGKLKTVAKHCRVEKNTFKQAENKCLITIRNEKEEKYYHCDNERVKELQEELKKACEPDKIPEFISRQPHFSQGKPVKIHFQTEERSGDEESGAKVDKIHFINSVMGPSEPWDAEDFAPFKYSLLSLLLLAIF